MHEGSKRDLSLLWHARENGRTLIRVEGLRRPNVVSSLPEWLQREPVSRKRTGLWSGKEENSLARRCADWLPRRAGQPHWENVAVTGARSGVVFGGGWDRGSHPHAGGLLVLVQVALECERLAAAAAHERLGGRVGLDVGAQVGLVGECLGALGALERLLAGVRADVALQQPGSGEALATEGTLAALAVRPHVHREGRHGHVHLGAVRTLARLLVRHAAVRLSVPRQVARGAVPLSALGACVVRLAASGAWEPRRSARLLKRSDLLQHGGEYAGRSGSCCWRQLRLCVVHRQAERLFGHCGRGGAREAGRRPGARRFPGGPAAVRRRLRSPR